MEVFGNYPFKRLRKIFMGVSSRLSSIAAVILRTRNPLPQPRADPIRRQPPETGQFPCYPICDSGCCETRAGWPDPCGQRPPGSFWAGYRSVSEWYRATPSCLDHIWGLGPALGQSLLAAVGL